MRRDLEKNSQALWCSYWSSVTHNYAYIIVVQSLRCIWLFAPQNARLPCSPQSLGVCSDSYPLSQWCCLTISSFVTPLSFGLQPLLALGSFSMSWLFTSGGQSVGTSASALPMNIQGWFPLGLTSLISLQSKGLSRVLSNTTVQKHQVFSTQFSLWSKSSIYNSWKNHNFDLCQQNDVFAF